MSRALGIKSISMQTMENEEMDIDDTPRTAEEIARRALVLSAVMSVAFGSPAEQIISWLKAENLWEEITPNELDFLNNPIDERNRVKFSWKVEALVALLWCINKVSKLPKLTNQCDTGPLKKAIVWPPEPTAGFISSSKLRSEKEISKEYEKIYQAHWSVRDARLNNKKIPKRLVPGVVYERHYGFNWVVGYGGQSWDDISTDT